MGNNWDSVLADVTESQLSLGCCLRFKYRNKTEFATVTCRECPAKIIYSSPDDTFDDTVIIILTFINPVDKFSHKHDYKRKVKRDSREDLKIKLRAKTPLCQFNEIVLENETSIGPLVPKLTTLRKIRSEPKMSDRREVDEYYCIRKLNKSKRRYNVVKCLQEIPNYINIFLLKSQEEIIGGLKKYILVVDASGSMANNPSQYETKNFEIGSEKFKPVYLYLAMVIADDNTKSIPISQMLSSDHSENGTKIWMDLFLKVAKKPPYEIRIDASSMFMTALSQVFNNCNTKDYLEKCYESIREKKWNLNTMIRLDKSHVVKIFRNWKAWNEANCGGIVKKFYIDVLKSLIAEDNFSVLKLISEKLVHLMMTEFCSEELSESNNILHDYISHRSHFFIENIDEEILKDNELIIDEELGYEGDSEGKLWIDLIFDRIEKENSSKTYDKPQINPFYLPKFKADIIRILRCSVMWTNILIPFSPHNHKDVCTSSVVESHFNIIKNNIFSNHTLPTKSATFMDTYLDHCQVQCILFNEQGNSTDILKENNQIKKNLERENECKLSKKHF